MAKCDSDKVKMTIDTKIENCDESLKETAVTITKYRLIALGNSLRNIFRQHLEDI
jgi:hypothetical protein